MHNNYNKEQIKELIGFLKIVFSITTIVSISLITWTFQNIDNRTLSWYIAYIVLIVCIYIVIKLVRFIIKLIDNLGDKNE